MTIYQIDAFTDRAFAGNPAGVCVTPGPLAVPFMQTIAAEMNVAETAFLHPVANGYNLRWFTPEVEVDLCGHATLAAAYLLWDRAFLLSSVPAVFHTRSGVLRATQSDGWITLDFPREEDDPIAAPEILVESLGTRPIYVGKNRMDYIVEVDSEETLRRMDPELTKLERLHARGVIVTSRSDSPEYDFVSRFFAPGAGVPEDPVTGSAHCCLGPYWQRKLLRSEFTAFQASSRGGIVKVRVNGDRVYLSGQAVHVLTAELLVDESALA